MMCWRGQEPKREAEVGAGRNTIKREQRVKGTDLVMGAQRRGAAPGSACTCAT